LEKAVVRKSFVDEVDRATSRFNASLPRLFDVLFVIGMDFFIEAHENPVGNHPEVEIA